MTLSHRLGLFSFLQEETGGLDLKMAILVASSGVANAISLAVINASVEALGKGGPSWQHFAWFALSILLFVYALRHVLHQSTRIAERAVCNVRVRLADKIRRCDLVAIEAIGGGDIHARISQDTAAVVQTARPLFAAAQAVVMILFTLIYIALVSPAAMLLCLALIGGGAVIYLKDRRAYESGLRAASREVDGMNQTLDGLLRGFKEVRINSRKGDDVVAEFESRASRVRDIRIEVMILFSNNIVFVELFLLSLLGAIPFVLPLLTDVFSGSETKIVAAILFFFGPLGNVMGMIPTLSETNVSVGNLRALEAQLDAALARSPESEARPTHDLSGFSRLDFVGLRFAYHDAEGNETFAVGPVDLTLRRGEVLFLVGGNGSGKTTLLKLLTALYPPQTGTIRLDGAEIGAGNRQSYRDLFSAIFADFHLFEKLHGLARIDPDRVAALLRQMDIAHKTGFADGQFTNIRLSTGQRKRLALVVSYLEDKPIAVFDEVAADQDPPFRHYFYHTLLPDLKAAGKTVVVVSHDDRYFDAADRVLRMEYGRLVEIAPPAPGEPGHDTRGG